MTLEGGCFSLSVLILKAGPQAVGMFNPVKSVGQENPNFLHLARNGQKLKHE